jgi:hypothetical protein
MSTPSVVQAHQIEPREKNVRKPNSICWYFVSILHTQSRKLDVELSFAANTDISNFYFYFVRRKFFNFKTKITHTIGSPFAFFSLSLPVQSTRERQTNKVNEIFISRFFSYCIFLAVCWLISLYSEIRHIFQHLSDWWKETISNMYN